MPVRGPRVWCRGLPWTTGTSPGRIGESSEKSQSEWNPSYCRWKEGRTDGEVGGNGGVSNENVLGRNAPSCIPGD